MKAPAKAIRYLSLPALFALVLGSVVAMPQKAWATDVATNLGVVLVDCTSGNLTNRSIAFSGGVGDYFFLISSEGNCTISDPGEVIDNEAATLQPSIAQKITVLKEGSFTVTDAGGTGRTFTVQAQPVFANQGTAPASPQTVDVSCRASSSSYASNVVYFRANGDTITLGNSSGSEECSSVTVESGSITLSGSSLLEDDDGAYAPITVTLNGEGTVRIVGQLDGVDQPPIYLYFVRGTAGNVDLGVDSHPADTPQPFVSYTDVFLKDGTTPINATVTATAQVGLLSDDFDIDRDDNPETVNWGIASSIIAVGAQGTGTLRVEFKDGDGNLVALPGLTATIQDIDAGQFVEVTNVQSYQLSSNPATDLTVDSFASGTLSVSSDADDYSSDDEQDHWLVMRFGETSSIEFTLGAILSRRATFLVNFNSTEFTAPPAVVSEQSERNRSVDSDDVAPAIALDLRATVGSPTSQASAFIEGQGLQVGSPYTLRLGPSGRILYEGTVPSSGRFDHLGGLPANLAPGQYVLELRATGEDGSALVLTQSFTVGAGGIITAISAAQPSGAGGAGLANTGVDQSMMSLWMGAMALVLLGMISVAMSRRSRRDTSAI